MPLRNPWDPTAACWAPQQSADCLSILMVDTEPDLKLDIMQPCALIPSKKNLFTMRPQDASHHDTSTIVTYVRTHAPTYLRAYLIG